MNPFTEVEMFEKELAEYTGAPYCVAVDSCTNALFLTLKFYNIKDQIIVFPRKTYLSMPMMALATENEVMFRDYYWSGVYEIEVPAKRHDIVLIDSAKRLHKYDYKLASSLFGHSNKKMTLFKSFHMKKHITSISGKGGAILTNDKDLYEWALKARWEGRQPYSDYKDPSQDINIIGYNMNMTPEEAVFLRRQLSTLDEYNRDLEEPNGYRNLDEFTIFKNCKIIHKNCSSESLIPVQLSLNI